MSADRQAPLDVFQSFGKIARLRRSCLITEKIDGTNACVSIQRLEYDAIGPALDDAVVLAVVAAADGCHYALRAQSRKQFITPAADNAGFARWAQDNANDLIMLGEGRHYGEWWGAGIQRRYDLDHKRFSLFNAARWGDNTGNERPACCHVVPVLYEGVFTTDAVDQALERLSQEGSHAAPGFDRPEGVVVYQVASGTYGKVLLVGDELPKSLAEASR